MAASSSRSSLENPNTFVTVSTWMIPRMRSLVLMGTQRVDRMLWRTMLFEARKRSSFVHRRSRWTGLSQRHGLEIVFEKLISQAAVSPCRVRAERGKSSRFAHPQHDHGPVCLDNLQHHFCGPVHEFPKIGHRNQIIDQPIHHGQPEVGLLENRKLRLIGKDDQRFQFAGRRVSSTVDLSARSRSEVGSTMRESSLVLQRILFMC